MISSNVIKCYSICRPSHYQGVISKCHQCTTTLRTPEEDLLKTAKPFHEMPSPPMWPIIGSFWVFLPVIGRYDALRQHIANRHKRQLYGNIWRERLGSFNLVFSVQAEDMETLLRNEGPYPNRSGLACLERYRKSRKKWYSTIGVSLAQGKEWQDLRKKTQKHLMKPKAVEAYMTSMQEVARDFVQRLQVIRDVNHEVPNFLEELYKWALESVALIGLDTRVGCFQSDSSDSDGLKLIQSVQIQFEQMNKVEGFARLFKKLPFPGWRKFEKASDDFSEIAFKYINRALDELNRIDRTEDKELTLLQAMLATEGLETGGAMVTVADMLFAGIDTTAHTAGFLLYQLAKNQDKQELLYQEVTKLTSSGGKLTPVIFSELRYLKCCLKESLRLHHIIPAGARVLENDVVFSGYRVPAKTLVAVLLPETAIDERYFENPSKFLPERWLNRQEKSYHPFASLPFGFGTRSCIGRRIAELEIICLITEVIRKYKVEYHHEDIGVHTKFIMTPDKPLRFCFIER